MTTWLVLRSGGDFTWAHVARLRAQLRGRVRVLTDLAWQGACSGVEAVPLRHGYPGWWSKLELCRPDIEGDVFYMDLDTTVLGPIDDLAEVGCTTLLQDFNGDIWRHKVLQSSLMYLHRISRTKMWNYWYGSEKRWMMSCHMQGDQQVFQRVLGTGPRIHRWQDQFPGAVVSYKRHVLSNDGVLPAGARVVVFHGKPRPWHIEELEHAHVSR